ncbi:MAG: 6-bladed beta-propeller, partial [Clostridia bacterium]|nr:6-bladed beta-propeller [Clostridia bacterium]
LSDLADHFRLIPLETTEESLLGEAEFYVCDRYILAYTDNGVYKFSPEGKFIKKIINAGKGPQEISDYYTSQKFFVAKNNLLYINDFQYDESILVYDILAETFLEPVKKCIPGYWSSIAVNDTGVIVGTPNIPRADDSIHYAVIFQNAGGDFISGIPNVKRQKGMADNGELSYQYPAIMTSENGLKLLFNNDDTLFSIGKERLSPYLVLEFATPRNYPPANIPQQGDRMINFPNADAPGFMIIKASVCEGSKVHNEGDYYSVMIETASNFVLLDKVNGSSALIKTYNDDLIGKTQDILKIIKDEEEMPDFPEILPNNKLMVVYDAYEILDAAEKEITESGFPKEITDQLQTISKNLKEEDNPVLLVGELKTNERMKE